MTAPVVLQHQLAIRRGGIHCIELVVCTQHNPTQRLLVGGACDVCVQLSVSRRHARERSAVRPIPPATRPASLPSVPSHPWPAAPPRARVQPGSAAAPTTAPGLGPPVACAFPLVTISPTTESVQQDEALHPLAAWLLRRAAPTLPAGILAAQDEQPEHHACRLEAHPAAPVLSSPAAAGVWSRRGVCPLVASNLMDTSSCTSRHATRPSSET